ncbi:MAG: para-nitrobenzyl esterase [Frankiaceae bacterium]|nr:para-nitrobenzyl esterase [Frankiaceae bacterium]
MTAAATEPASSSTAVPEVRVAAGALRGTLDHGVPAYLGIPYAAPPFGALRMQPPAPAAPWDGTRDATSYGPTVPKGEYPPQYQSFLPEPVIAGEDCLNLNVWTPDPQATGLPVFVWIHGGSFMNGSGAVGAYRGSSFARDGVVCVTINYRLQAEGFLHTPDGTSNLGLLDQIAALTWVRQNIASFGGDPAKVTVGGESAGAMSVTTLLAMPSTEGLFRAAITESGAAAHTMTPDIAAKVTGLLAEELGVAPTRAAIAEQPPEQVWAAAEKLVNEVQTAPDPAKWGALALSLLPFMPTVDGDVLPQAPLDAFAHGAGADVALLTGTTAEEARLFFVAPGVIDLLDQPTAELGASAYGVDGAAALELYAGAGPSPGDRLAAVVTDWFFRVPAVRVAETRTGLDGPPVGRAPTWMYRCDYRSTAGGGKLGAAHATEIPFVFDTLDSPDAPAILGDSPPQAVADAMHEAWVRFVRDLDPGWPPYDTTHRITQVFDTAGATVVEDPDADQLALWAGIR